ncbi:MAG: hypothetical protein HY651_02810 [Acidobacteria bacterium]|nr:hypothetical protein [Acidobacteriota bacterium]
MAELALLLLIIGIVLAVRNWVRPHLGTDLESLAPNTESPKTDALPDVTIRQFLVITPEWKTKQTTVVGHVVHKTLTRALIAKCSTCLDPIQTLFSIAVDSAGKKHHCCLRCLRKYGGQDQFERAIRESDDAANVWRYMQALDQLRSDFPDPNRRPWGEEMLLNAIERCYLGERGERIVQKILDRNWDARDLARIEGRPDPGPPTRKVHPYSGTGTMVFSDGKRMPVKYSISLWCYFQDGQLTASWIHGRVWHPSGRSLGKRYVGRIFILEMPGNKKISLVIKEDGTISRFPGIIEGFPDVKAG